MLKLMLADKIISSVAAHVQYILNCMTLCSQMQVKDSPLGMFLTKCLSTKG